MDSLINLLITQNFEMLKIIIKNSKSEHKTEIKEKHIMSTLRNKTITLITKEESTLKKVMPQSENDGQLL